MRCFFKISYDLFYFLFFFYIVFNMYIVFFFSFSMKGYVGNEGIWYECGLKIILIFVKINCMIIKMRFFCWMVNKSFWNFIERKIFVVGNILMFVINLVDLIFYWCGCFVLMLCFFFIIMLDKILWYYVIL